MMKSRLFSAVTGAVVLASSTVPAHASESAEAYAAGRAGFIAYQAVEITTGESVGSRNEHDALRAASVIKAVLSAVALDRAQTSTTERRAVAALVRRAITVSDNNAASALYRRAGYEAGVLRWWSAKELPKGAVRHDPAREGGSPWGFLNVDAAGLASFASRLADGTLLEKRDQELLLSEMSKVVRTQRFGAAEIVSEVEKGAWAAVKNGWYPDGGNWRVTCLAVTYHRDGTPWLSIAILNSYPSRLGVRYGERSCREISRRLLVSTTPESEQYRRSPVRPIR